MTEGRPSWFCGNDLWHTNGISAQITRGSRSINVSGLISSSPSRLARSVQTRRPSFGSPVHGARDHSMKANGLIEARLMSAMAQTAARKRTSPEVRDGPKSEVRQMSFRHPRRAKEKDRLAAVSPSLTDARSSNSLERLPRSLIGAIEGSSRFRQSRHECGP